MEKQTEVSEHESVRQRNTGATEEQISQPSNNPQPKAESLHQRIRHYIGLRRDAPEYVVDNHNIHRGYRINFDSTKKILKSLFMMHNETINIWTHVIGFIMVLLLCLCVANSYNLFDVQGVRTRVTSRLNEKLDSVYREFKEFDDALNQRIAEGQHLLHDGMTDLNQGLSSRLATISSELQSFMEELRAHNFTDVYENFKELPHRFRAFLSEEVADLSQSAVTHFTGLSKTVTTIDELATAVRGNLSQLFSYANLHDSLLSKIDSPEYDWIDLLAYLNVTDGDKLVGLHNAAFQKAQKQHHVSRWPILVFLVSAALCLFFSSLFHLVYVMSPRVNRFFLRLDYAGVCLLIAGSTFPLYYYGFYCHSTLAMIYLSIIGFSCLVVFFVSLQDFIHMPEYLTCKSWMYAILGIGAAVPMIHLSILEYNHQQLLAAGGINAANVDTYSSASSYIYYVLMGVSYLSGLYIYTKRCPEKYKPGHFDYCGASHQIWHVSIIIAIVLTYIGSLINFYTRIENQCPLQ